MLTYLDILLKWKLAISDVLHVIGLPGRMRAARVRPLPEGAGHSSESAADQPPAGSSGLQGVAHHRLQPELQLRAARHAQHEPAHQAPELLQ